MAAGLCGATIWGSQASQWSSFRSGSKGGTMKVSKKRLLAVVAALVALTMVATGCVAAVRATSGGTERGQRSQDRHRCSADRRRGRTRPGYGARREARDRAGQRVRGRQGRRHQVRRVPGDDQGDPKTGVTVANTVRVRPEPRRRHGPPELGCLDSGFQGLRRQEDRHDLPGLDQPGADPAGSHQRLPRLHHRRGPGSGCC